MNKSYQAAPAVDLFGMEAPTKRTNSKPEAAALCEVLQALRANPMVAWCERMNTGAATWCERMNTGAAKVGNRFIRFGWPGCSDILGMLRDGRILCCEVKSPTGRLRPEQAVFLDRVRSGGGVAFVARDCRDVIRELNRPTGQGKST